MLINFHKPVRAGFVKFPLSKNPFKYGSVYNEIFFLLLQLNI